MRKPPRPLTRRRERERFARAVERGRDPDFDDELAVVAALRNLGDGPTVTTLDEDARARIARGATAPRPPEPRKRASTRQPRSRGLAPALATGLVLLLALAGAGLFLSDDALPGDPLYDLKRAGESAVLGTTFDDEAEALQHLEYAEARVDELTALAERAEPGNRGYVIGVADFAADTRAGVAQLTGVATASDGSLLDPLRTWALRQADRFHALRQALPEELASEPRRLLLRVAVRAEALSGRMNCYRVTSGRTDELGPLPATGPCATPGDRHEVPSPAPSVPPAIPSPAPGTPADEPRRETVMVATGTTPPTGHRVAPAVPTAPLIPMPASSAPVAVPAPIPAAPAPPVTSPAPPTPSDPPLLPGLPDLPDLPGLGHLPWLLQGAGG